MNPKYIDTLIIDSKKREKWETETYNGWWFIFDNKGKYQGFGQTEKAAWWDALCNPRRLFKWRVTV